MFTRQSVDPLWVYTDGAICARRGVSGLAAVARDEYGRVLHWWCRRAGRLTCNEAEYAAVIMALECLTRLRPRPRSVVICSDSRIVVDLTLGRVTARSDGMRQALERLRPLAAQFEQAAFKHINRERNGLADALANEVAQGWIEESA